MASHVTLARPYAKALFASALADDLLTPWGEVLAALSCVAEDKRVVQLINDPKLSSEVVASFFAELCRAIALPAASAVDERLNHFLAVLAQAKRLAALPHIAALYHRLLAEQKKILEVDVVSAHALSASQQENLKRAIEARFKSDVSLAFHEDASLIGGAVIRSSTWVIDGSVRGQLTALKDCLSVE